MNTTFPIVLIVAALTAGCADKNAGEAMASEEAAAKARAKAGRKEMETVPKVFRPQYHNNRLVEPESKNPQQTSTPTSKS